MLLSTALCLFFIAWSSTFLIDYYLRLKNYRAYINCADRYGLQVSPFQLRVYTSRHGRDDSELLSSSPSYIVSLFYSIGAIVAIIAQIGITFYLSKLLFSDLAGLFASKPPTVPPTVPSTSIDPSAQVIGDKTDDVVDGQQTGLVPIVPGVNLPVGHIPAFMIVLVLCAVFHELGHAWCARSKGVGVNGFGLFLLGIYPGAFTEIDNNSLQRAPTWSRVQIYTAGIWHNLLLAGFAYLLYANAHVLLSPTYTTGRGVMITDVDPSSGLYGAGGLQLGDVVTRIDDCEVRSSTSWSSCIRYRRRSIDGKCIPAEKLWMYASNTYEVSDNEVHCCPNATVSHLCFESNVVVPRTHDAAPPSTPRPPPLVELAGGVVVVAKKEEIEQREVYACLHARETLEGESCNRTESCTAKAHRCVYPALFNGTKLVKLSVEGKQRPVIFVGSFSELQYLVEYTELSPRISSLLAPVWLPTLVDLVAKYLLAFSLALGLLNALPCFALDGQFIMYTLVHTYLRAHMPKRRRSGLIRLLLCYGTAILIGNILIGFWRLYRTLR